MHFDRLSVALFAQCHPNPQTRIPASLWQSIGDGQIKLEIFTEINSIPGTIFAGYFTIHSNALFATSPPNLHNISNTNHYPLFWHAFRKAIHTYPPLHFWHAFRKAITLHSWHALRQAQCTNFRRHFTLC